MQTDLASFNMFPMWMGLIAHSKHSLGGYVFQLTAQEMLQGSTFSGHIGPLWALNFDQLIYILVDTCRTLLGSLLKAE